MMHNKSTFLAAGTARCAVTARKAGGRCAFAVSALLLFLIQLYRWILSPAQIFLFGGGSGCRFTPTCSQYATEAIRHHGAVAGSILALKRICRCHPLGDCGFDPVPHGNHHNQEREGRLILNG